MNRSRLLFIGTIALALGAFVSFAVYSRLKSSATADTRPGVDVVVAADDLQVGARIQDHDVQVVRFRRNSAPQYLSPYAAGIGRGVDPGNHKRRIHSARTSSRERTAARVSLHSFRRGCWRMRCG